MMYSRISIKNFRGIESLEAEGFRHINLIVGRNNSGKTTFLDASPPGRGDEPAVVDDSRKVAPPTVRRRLS